MPVSGKRGRSDATSGMESFFEQVTKSEDELLRKMKKQKKSNSSELNSFFNEVNRSEKEVLSKQAKQGERPTVSLSKERPPQLSNDKPVAAAHHAPLDFDDVILPPDLVPVTSSYPTSIAVASPSIKIGTSADMTANGGETLVVSRSQAGRIAPTRVAAGKQWKDESLLDWPENDYRLFVGNLDREAKLDHLEKAFSHYPSFAKAKLVMNNFKEPGTDKFMCKGYGFVSFLDPMECAKALRAENGKYCGLRPMQLKKSTWQSRNKPGKAEQLLKVKMGAKKF